MGRGVAPDRIAFVTFTKKAAEEAKTRAAAKFSLDPEADMPWFRTIHSLAYRLLGMTKEEVMGPKDWKLFSAMIGEGISGHYDADSPVPSGKTGDVMLRIVDYAATTMQTLEEAWRELDEAVDWFLLKRFFESFTYFKGDISKMDFTDMLLTYIQNGEPIPVEVAVIDEAQDLTKAQWKAVELAFRNAKRIYVAGDDDQAIYRWAGADVDHFLTLSTRPEVLGHSYRLPRAIFKYSQTIVRRIRYRYAKPVQPSDRDGRVLHHNSPDSVDLSERGSWLLLARNGYTLSNLEQIVRDSGFNYTTRKRLAINAEHVEAIRTWERVRSRKITTLNAGNVRTISKFLGRPVPQLRELAEYRPEDMGWPLDKPWHEVTDIDPGTRDYYISCLRRGTKLWDPPRIHIDTIHGVKGGEADNVLIMSDFSGKTAAGYYKAPDHEHRVYYVGVTRARHALHIVAPQSDLAYPL